MEERPVETLVDRMDAALGRIERAIARSDGDLRELSAKHERLKAAVGEALGEIDTLLAQVLK